MSPEQTAGQAPVETVDYTMKVPKETKEIVDAECALLKHFINGGSLEGAVALLPMMMTAVNGYEKVPAELKSQYNDEAAGYLIHKQWDSLKKDGQ